MTGGATFTIDFGASNPGEVLTFTTISNYKASDQIDIINYNPADDHLVFSSLTAPNAFIGAYLSNNAISIDGSTAVGQLTYSGGGLEVRPVPEPATWLWSVLLILFIMRQARLSEVKQGSYNSFR